MPLHADRWRERGFNQATELARPVARALGVKLEERFLRRARSTPPLWRLGPGDRRRLVAGAFEARGDLAGITTTSGWSWKIPGRVGDSPILGAGLYVDNDFGAAGSTGRGEANLYSLASFLIVEFMRQVYERFFRTVARNEHK